jgi:hypothetical protein
MQMLQVHLAQEQPDAVLAQKCLARLSGQALAGGPPPVVQPEPQEREPQMRVPAPEQQEALPPASDPEG